MKYTITTKDDQKFTVFSLTYGDAGANFRAEWDEVGCTVTIEWKGGATQ